MTPKILLFLLLLLFISEALPAADNAVVYLNKIILNGMHTNSPEEALKLLSVKEKQAFEPEQIEIIKQELTSFMQSKGFYNAQINQPEIVPVSPVLVDLSFDIDEGKPSLITQLRFEGNRYFSETKLLSLLNYSKTTELAFLQLPVLQNRILSLYTARGYLFCTVRLDSLLQRDSGFNAVLHIEEGPLFKATHYVFSGNKITRANTILQISGLSQARQITPEVLIQAENNLLRKAYIKTCRIVPLNENTLQVMLEEGKMTRLEGVMGLSTNRVTQKRELNGFADIRFMNLWGSDRALNLTWRSLQTGYQMLRLAYHESGLLQYPVAGDLSFAREKQDSLWIKLRAETDVYYRMLYSKLGLELYTENLYPGADSTTTVTKTDYQKLGAFWEYEKMDYSPNPRSGNTVSVKYGWVLSASEEERKSVPSTEFDLGTFIPLQDKLVLAISAHGRQIADKKARSYEQYKMGGFSSLRGYYEDEFSSWRLGWVNTEVRYLLTTDSRLFVLADSGYLQLPDGKSKTDLFAFGTGISFGSKLGIFSLSYALSYTDKRLSGMSSGMLHIGLDSSF